MKIPTSSLTFEILQSISRDLSNEDLTIIGDVALSILFIGFNSAFNCLSRKYNMRLIHDDDGIGYWEFKNPDEYAEFILKYM